VLEALARHPVAVEEGAVRALEVLDPPTLAVPLDARVLARDALQRYGHGRGIVPAEHDAARADLEARRLAPAQARPQLGLQGRAGGLGGGNGRGSVLGRGCGLVAGLRGRGGLRRRRLGRGSGLLGSGGR
jgi:hypothetical protein